MAAYACYYGDIGTQTQFYTGWWKGTKNKVATGIIIIMSNYLVNLLHISHTHVDIRKPVNVDLFGITFFLQLQMAIAFSRWNLQPFRRKSKRNQECIIIIILITYCTIKRNLWMNWWLFSLVVCERGSAFFAIECWLPSCRHNHGIGQTERKEIAHS